MGFENIPSPGESGNEEERIRFKEGGREFSMTPEEEEAHEEAERKRKALEKKGGVMESEENEGQSLELTEEEQKILEGIVPGAETRAQLGPEATRWIIDMKKEELKEKKEKKAA